MLYSDSINKSLTNFNILKAFWRRLKFMSSKTNVTLNSISSEEWKNYFENLFNLEEGDNVVEPDMILINTEYEIEDIIFNSEISDDEILRAVKGLKSGTSGGEDNLIPEFFIHGIDFRLPFCVKYLTDCLILELFP